MPVFPAHLCSLQVRTSTLWLSCCYPPLSSEPLGFNLSMQKWRPVALQGFCWPLAPSDWDCWDIQPHRLHATGFSISPECSQPLFDYPYCISQSNKSLFENPQLSFLIKSCVSYLHASRPVSMDGRRLFSSISLIRGDFICSLLDFFFYVKEYTHVFLWSKQIAKDLKINIPYTKVNNSRRLALHPFANVLAGIKGVLGIPCPPPPWVSKY